MKCPNCNYEFEIESQKNHLQKKGMAEKSKQGFVMSRAPFGYRLEKGKLIPSEDSRKVEDLFLDFKEKDFTLSQLSKKYNLSINGLKKVLRNFTYLGKIKFNGEVYQGNHKPLISSILFNQVQDKLERLNIK
jgi:site-specific DNA recombinase